MDNTSEQPRSLQVEVTNNCNFNCIMCIRNMWRGERLGYINPRLFIKMVDELDYSLERLALYGIGEPLLHPDLTYIIREYRRKHGDSTHILIVSNGSLATPERVEKLFENGLNQLVFSIDSSDLARLSRIRVGSYGYTLFHNLAEAVKIAGKYGGTIGVATILMAENLEDLPSLVEKSAKLGVHSLVISHLITYTHTLVDQALYSLASEYPVKLIMEMGVDNWEEIAYSACTEIIREQYSRSELLWREKYRLVVEDSMRKGYGINIANIRHTISKMNILNRALEILRKAQEKASEAGLYLDAPGVFPDATKRSCPYIDGDYAYVRYDGIVSPCMDLAYEHPLFINGHYKVIRRVIFGDLNRESLKTIWLKPEYIRFRRIRRDLPRNIPWCSDCNLSSLGCWYVEENGFDCYGNEVGCSECIYSTGLAKCII